MLISFEALTAYINPVLQVLGGLAALFVAVFTALNRMESWLEHRADRILHERIEESLIKRLRREMDNPDMSDHTKDLMETFIDDYEQ